MNAWTLASSILTLALALHGRAAGPPISFHELAAGERADVKFVTRGCFHNATYHLRFMGGQAKIVSIEGTEWGKPVRLGTLSLSPEEVAGLDRLLTFYRSPRHSGCTTEDQITVTLVKKGAITARESFKDESCGTYDLKAVTTFEYLIHKLGQQQSVKK